MQTRYAFVDIFLEGPLLTFAVLVLDRCVRLQQAVRHGYAHGALRAGTGVAALARLGCRVVLFVVEEAPAESVFHVDCEGRC